MNKICILGEEEELDSCKEFYIYLMNYVILYQIMMKNGFKWILIIFLISLLNMKYKNYQNIYMYLIIKYYLDVIQLMN